MKAQIKTSETPPVSLAVSGFFDNEQAIEQAMHGCLQRGIPRDLIEVAVSPQAAPHFFGGKTGKPRDSWFSWAGRGALTGLLLTAAVSLILVMLPGYTTSRSMAVVQLLGPDIGVIAGAALGALYGMLKPVTVSPQLQRVTERGDSALMLVHLLSVQEASIIEAVFKANGASHVEAEPDSLTMTATA